MFHLSYIRRELTRRAGRTILTVLGLAVGVALVVAITAVAGGLDDAQGKVLDPLNSVGTDLLVTRPVAAPANGAGGAQAAPGGTAPGTGTQGGNGGAGGNGGLSAADQQALLQENSSVITDLSKLGNPGDHFVHDFYLPATQLTFPDDEAKTVAAVPGVKDVAQGLTLLAQHEEGTVPQIFATFQTGGEQIQVDQQISPPTPEEEAQIQACLQAHGVQPGTGGAGGGGGNQPGAGNGGTRGGFGGALRECLPERFQRFRGTFTTPQRTITQIVNPPQTDITTESYTIAGVDPSKPGMGVITAAQVEKGRFLTEASGDTPHEALLADGYAKRKGLDVGSTVTFNGTSFTVAGIVQPPLGGQSADVYLTLSDLQTLSSRASRVNVLYVRADKAADVTAVADRIKAAFPGSTVTSAGDVAGKISGSLVDAANLAHRLGRVLAVVVLVTAFLVAALLTLSSVAKRVRELGTLKAIGWRQGQVVRQVVGEAVVQGVLGGVVGAAIGVGAAELARHLAPTLEASAPSTTTSVFGLRAASSAGKVLVHVPAPVHAGLLLAAVGLAVVGGLVAGAAGALRAARLRPADALRELG